MAHPISCTIRSTVELVNGGDGRERRQLSGTVPLWECIAWFRYTRVCPSISVGDGRLTIQSLCLIDSFVHFFLSAMHRKKYNIFILQPVGCTYTYLPKVKLPSSRALGDCGWAWCSRGRRGNLLCFAVQVHGRSAYLSP